MLSIYVMNARFKMHLYMDLGYALHLRIFPSIGQQIARVPQK